MVMTRLFRDSPPRWRLLLASGIIAVVAGETLGQPPDVNTARESEKTETTGRGATAALSKAGKAVVQIVDEGEVGGFSITGVTVSADGYVLSRWMIGSRSLVKVRFANGRTATAKPLGWSGEWNLGVWKILDEGVWPCVEIGSTADVSVGQSVGLIDYRADEQSGQAGPLVVRRAAIEHVIPEKWFMTTGVGGTFEFPPLFSMDGRLLGFTATAYGGDTRKIATAAEVVTANWQDLVAGKNLDWVRFPPRGNPFWRHGPEPLGEPASGDKAERIPVLADSRKTAFDTTVRLISKSRPNFNGSGKERWSGVIVSEEGHILTCGHAEPLPGEQLTVQLSDGRDFSGIVLESNWISDVALAKITDSGAWPFAEIVDSSYLEVGDPLVASGYPAMTREGKISTDRNPVVCALRVRRQRPVRLWRCTLPLTFNGTRECKIRGGMSGGGVFDSRGRYVGVLTSSGEAVRSEVVRLRWDHIIGNEPPRMPEEAGGVPNAD